VGEFAFAKMQPCIKQALKSALTMALRPNNSFKPNPDLTLAWYSFKKTKNNHCQKTSLAATPTTYAAIG